MSLADREHLPKVVTDVDGIRDILLALDPEIVLLREDISQLIKELYVSTTEKYIDRWEQDFSLPYDGSLTLEQRRQRIKNKLARKKVLNWQNLRLLIKNNVVKPRFYIVNEAENYHFKIFLEQQPQRQEFDLSKFTVVGSPTITEYGVASGFSRSSYLTVNNITLLDNNWNFILKFSTQDVSTNQGVLSFSSGYTIGVVVNPDGGRFWVSLGQGTSFNIGEFGFKIEANKEYTIKIGYDGEKYFISELVGNEFIVIKSFISSLKVPSNLGIARLGIHRNNNSFLNGSIDLSQFSITVDGKEVFSGIKNIDYITNELRTSLKQAKPAYLTYDIIVTEFFTRYCGTFSSGTEPL